jgi:two-component system response regulator
VTKSVEILLVEDNPCDIELTLHALSHNKVTASVETVRDGAEALEFLFGSSADPERDAKVPQLILLDLKLPRVDGLEVLRQVKVDRRTRCIPVVVLTSSGEDSDIGRCYELGANSYVVKPVEFEKFCDAVHQVGVYWMQLNHPPAPA